jgi:hypothetical protein
MKILAKFLLSSVFVFLTAGVAAQAQDCGVPLTLKMGLDREVGATVKALEDGQDCLNDSLKSLKLDVENLQSPLRSNDDLKTEILELQNQLEQTKLDLRATEMKIETLQHSYDMLSHLFDRMLNDRLNGSGLAAPKPKAPASKPLTQWDAQGNPIQPANKPTAPASKPKAPVNEPTPAGKEGTH